MSPGQAGKFPKFVSKEMEAMYIEELKSSVNQLMANLESMPVSKGGEFKLQKLKRGHNTSIIDMGQEDENTLSKSDVVLSFTLEVRRAKRLQSSELFLPLGKSTAEVFCVLAHPEHLLPTSTEATAQKLLFSPSDFSLRREEKMNSLWFAQHSPRSESAVPRTLMHYD